MYYNSGKVCGNYSIKTAGGEPSGHVDRSSRAGWTMNLLPLGRSSSNHKYISEIEELKEIKLEKIFYIIEYNLSN
ncbi:MAG: hypothetical protein ACFFD2_14195 [Promethearchaeota archaeon]